METYGAESKFCFHSGLYHLQPAQAAATRRRRMRVRRLQEGASCSVILASGG